MAIALQWLFVKSPTFFVAENCLTKMANWYRSSSKFIGQYFHRSWVRILPLNIFFEREKESRCCHHRYSNFKNAIARLYHLVKRHHLVVYSAPNIDFIGPRSPQISVIQPTRLDRSRNSSEIAWNFTNHPFRQSKAWNHRLNIRSAHWTYPSSDWLPAWHKNHFKSFWLLLWSSSSSTSLCY